MTKYWECVSQQWYIYVYILYIYIFRYRYIHIYIFRYRYIMIYIYIYLCFCQSKNRKIESMEKKNNSKTLRIFSQDHACSMWHPLWWYSCHLRESLVASSIPIHQSTNPQPRDPSQLIPTIQWIPGIWLQVMIWCHGNSSLTPHLPYSMLVHQNHRCLHASFWRWRTTWDVGMFLEVMDMSSMTLTCHVDRKIASKASMRPWNSVQLGCRSSWPSRAGGFP